MASKNENLRKAKKAKNDEFFTRIEDIEKELVNYQDFFKDKVVYCNCDHPTESNFPRYFILNFEKLGLKKLVSTCFISDSKGWVGTKEKDCEYTIEQLASDGDFRSEECIEFLKECDVVVTNPPFSLFREYIAQLIEYEKKFLVIGNLNAITYKDIFSLIKDNKIWMGTTYFNGGAAYFYGDAKVFDVNKIANPKNAWVENGKLYWRVNGVRWFTNIEHKKRNTPIDIYKTYSAENYPKYDNYDAIEVSKVVEIPEDYKGVMGVPISFLDKYCPTQFQIVKFRKGDDNKDLSVNGKCPYFRILIKRVKNNETK